MLRTLARISLILLCLGMFSTGLAQAQTLIWNVPSPDVADKNQASLTMIPYLRPWNTGSGRSEFTYFQGVYGIGSIGSMPTEVGLNVGPIDLRHTSKGTPFADAAIKVRLLHTQLNADTLIEATIGNNVGIGLDGTTSGHVRDFVYGGLSAQFGLTGTRVSAGPYYATKEVFGGHARAGGQFTLEQSLPLVSGLSFAADFQTGHGGLFTPGLIWSKNQFTLGAGYGFANTGRQDDLVTLVGSFRF